MFIRKLFTLFRAYESRCRPGGDRRPCSEDPRAGAARRRGGQSAGDPRSHRPDGPRDGRPAQSTRRPTSACAEHEAYALKALAKGDEALARQCAEIVAAAEAERERYGRNLRGGAAPHRLPARRHRQGRCADRRDPPRMAGRPLAHGAAARALARCAKRRRPVECARCRRGDAVAHQGAPERRRRPRGCRRAPG